MNKDNYELLSLKDIFSHGKRSFVIPEYQRGYSWEKKQREDLLIDIENLFISSYRHYTGTIVASYKRTEEVEIYDIVDGQQRLTTIVILLAVIYNQKKLTVINQNELFSYFIATGVDKGNTIRKFSLNSLLDNFFYKHIILENQDNEEILTKSHFNISNAFDEFSIWLKETNYNHNEIYRIITERLGLLFYAPKDGAEIGIMFEVINNRGKKLSELEKIKNYLIYYSEKNNVKDLKTTIDSNWGIILKNLNQAGYTSNDAENSFLRNCWIVFADTNKSRSYYVYDTLKEWYPANDKTKWQTLKDFVLFLANASYTYQYIFGKKDIQEISKIEKKWLSYMSLHASIASILPIIIALFERVDNQEERGVILELLEKLNFRYYGSGIANRADTSQGDLFWYAHKFFNSYDNYNEEKTFIYDTNWLINKLKSFIESKAHDQLFIEYLTLDKDEDYDYYGWNNIRFFLANYEEFLRKKHDRSTDLCKILASQDKNAKNDYYHKEHIWARKEFSVTDDINNINKRRLGNFVLLEPSINISVSNDRVEDKIIEYFKKTQDQPDTYMLRELKSIFDKSLEEINSQRTKKTWKFWHELYENFLDKREEKLINFALNRWRVDSLKKEVKKIFIRSNTSHNNVYFFNKKEIEY
ncbi:DUF262 domain-containing protein [Arcobacter venerupis]|uniref:DUF262 domain-containing protein n=1 Tax=Arcobacter venerupis TaxID=1054033 RepID=A0AAE7B7J2_9BACT|nr:DUF262 domain-containing protein [Arcobacter venerupis]QKF66541.1 DUF262 domain-containing protein [Arcobacter venerupis]RWS49720.1 hypothetical protein CKA56_08355 [Arcobacter venerupis]